MDQNKEIADLLKDVYISLDTSAILTDDMGARIVNALSRLAATNVGFVYHVPDTVGTMSKENTTSTIVVQTDMNAARNLGLDNGKKSRKPWSPAARKAAALRMKARWAAKRKAKNGKRKQPTR